MIVIRRMASGIAEHFPSRFTEWAMSYALLCWGIALAGPDDVFKTSPAWKHLEEIASESTWASVAIGVSSLRLIALIINGTFYDTWWGRWSPHVRAILSAASCFIWVQVYIGLARSGLNITLLGLIKASAAICFFNAYRAAADSGRADRDYNRGRT